MMASEFTFTLTPPDAEHALSKVRLDLVAEAGLVAIKSIISEFGGSFYGGDVSAKTGLKNARNPASPGFVTLSIAGGTGNLIRTKAQEGKHKRRMFEIIRDNLSSALPSGVPCSISFKS